MAASITAWALCNHIVVGMGRGTDGFSDWTERQLQKVRLWHLQLC